MNTVQAGAVAAPSVICRSVRFKPVCLAVLACLPACSWAQASGENVLSTVVVTARRAEASVAVTPQRVEVITREEIDNTPSRELVDVLKKHVGINVIQNPNNLSGIGIRGFTPEYSGIDKRSLVLVDGRPAMSTNLSLINLDQVERIEVLKGPASALYGSSAMGGVVNIITRTRSGAPGASIELAAGSFGLREVKGSAGGQLSDTVSVDYSGAWLDRGDYATGRGTLQNSAYEQQQHALRLAWQLQPDWQLQAGVEKYYGRDIGAPDDVAYEIPERNLKDMDRETFDVRLSGRIGSDHLLSATLFGGSEWYQYTTHAGVWYNPELLPSPSYSEDMDYWGWQLRHQWNWSETASLVWGVDHEQTEVNGKSWDLYATGGRSAPFSADNRRRATGVYVENSWYLNDDETVIQLGVRHDTFRIRTLPTPYKTDFTPNSSSFDTTNPSIGFKQLLGGGLRFHATAGRAFVAPSALQFTGEARALNWEGRAEITRGNPNLRPETSTTVDAGLEWAGSHGYVDVTVFDTRVKDKIVRDNGQLIDGNTTLFTYINSDRARMRGLEVEARWVLRPGFELSAGLTHMFKAQQQFADGWQDLNNVAKQNAYWGLDVSAGRWSGRLGGRYVGRSKDLDWVHSGGSQVEYGGFAVWDAAARYQWDARQSVALSVENLFDRYHAEKQGFPQPGRAVRLSYRYAF